MKDSKRSIPDSSKILTSLAKYNSVPHIPQSYLFLQAHRIGAQAADQAFVLNSILKILAKAGHQHCALQGMLSGMLHAPRLQLLGCSKKEKRVKCSLTVSGFLCLTASVLLLSD